MSSYQSYNLSPYPQRAPRVYQQPGQYAQAYSSRRPDAPAAAFQDDGIYEQRDIPRPSTKKFGPDQTGNVLSPPPSYNTANGKRLADDVKLRDYKGDEDNVEAGFPISEPLPTRGVLCGLNPRRVIIGVALAVATAVAIGVGYAVTHRGHSNDKAAIPATNGTASATPTVSATPTSSATSSATPTPVVGQLLDGTYQVYGTLASAPCVGGATGLSCASSVSEFWDFSRSGNSYNIEPEGLKNVSASATNGALSFQYGSGIHSGSGCIVQNADSAEFTLLGDHFNGTLQSVNTITKACNAGPVNSYCTCVYDITGA